MEEARIGIGDQVEMRKPHACGGNLWTVTRTGADVRVRCDRCGRSVMLSRERFARAVRRHLRTPPAASPGDQP